MVEKQEPTNPVNIEIHKAAERMLVECPFLFEIVCEKNISQVFLSIAPTVMEMIALAMKTCPWEVYDDQLLAKVKSMIEATTPDNLEYVEAICGRENNSDEDIDDQKINVEVHMKHAVTKEVGWFAVTTHFVSGSGVDNFVG
jgi:hypothetical protein